MVPFRVKIVRAGEGLKDFVVFSTQVVVKHHWRPGWVLQSQEVAKGKSNRPWLRSNTIIRDFKVLHDNKKQTIYLKYLNVSIFVGSE